VVTARSYGRMQFADYLGSYALQSLNRCLLRVGAGELTAKDERLLREQIDHLQSLWQLMQWSVGKLTHAEATARLRESHHLLNPPSGAAQAAAQLLEFADEKTAQAVSLVARTIDSSRVPADRQHDRLSVLLQDESACWRDYAPLRQIAETALIEHGMGRAYGKARRLAQRLDAGSVAGAKPPGSKRLTRTHRWVGHAANHLDLLRPALDDSGRAQRWHLRRLQAKLEQQLGLELFAVRAAAAELTGKQRGRIDALVERHRGHLDKQRVKLSRGAFGLAPGEFERYAMAAVDQLGLHEITLLPLEATSASA